LASGSLLECIFAFFLTVQSWDDKNNNNDI
jgi:hypothetical protein